MKQEIKTLLELSTHKGAESSIRKTKQNKSTKTQVNAGKSVQSSEEEIMWLWFIHHTRGESPPGPWSSWCRCLLSANSISAAQLPFQRLKKSSLWLTQSFFQESSHLTLSWLIACKEGFSRGFGRIYFFPHMKEILKKRPSTEHHSWDVAILWDTRGGTRAWQRHQMGSDISETLNHCQRPQISRSLIMWDIARQVFCYLKLKAFITIPKNGSHTEDRNVSSHLNSIMIFL